MIDITKKQLIPIGGHIGENFTITIFMHEGYDIPICMEAHLKNSLNIPYNTLCLIYGNIENPAFSWPTYALKKKKVNPNS